MGLGAVCALPVLLVGAILGWLRLRRALRSLWSREGPMVGADAPPFRRSAQHVPIAGASRWTTVMVATVYAAGFVGAGRVPLAWVAVNDLIDEGHWRSGLVPADARGAVLALA